METAKYIIVSDKRTKHILPLEDILYVEAIRIYSVFHMKNSTHQYIASRNLEKIYRELKDNNFLRVHRSHIINLNEIKAVQQGKGAKVILSDNTMITIANRRKTELLLYLKNINRIEKRKPEKAKANYYASKQINGIKPIR